MAEIDSVLWARMRHQEPHQGELEDMYQRLQTLKAERDGNSVGD